MGLIYLDNEDSDSKITSVPGKRKSVGRITSSSVCMKLVKPEIDPTDDQAAAEHRAIGPLDQAYGPHDERKTKN